jgi:hypothetical protein
MSLFRESFSFFKTALAFSLISIAVIEIHNANSSDAISWAWDGDVVPSSISSDFLNKNHRVTRFVSFDTGRETILYANFSTDGEDISLLLHKIEHVFIYIIGSLSNTHIVGEENVWGFVNKKPVRLGEMGLLHRRAGQVNSRNTPRGYLQRRCSTGICQLVTNHNFSSADSGIDTNIINSNIAYAEPKDVGQPP